jgi:CheY-like chemotaxis protein
VLLIDDSHEDLFLAKRLLARAEIKHPIVTIDGGAEALVFLRAATSPDGGQLMPLVIFCDIKMPGQNGFDVLKWARSQAALARVPIYMMSGADLEIDRQRAIAMGATGYLPKFPLPEVLKEIIERAEQG